ncbi:hypothetical protein Aca07nite_86800 [Actinoplanes capillaceus]|uniref:Novel STAND NTPase 1 domain-containing protein n=1 Tax=Actinoplanes campanulatus TaxID=113559 RepID=A0ABQ3WZ46_9ACTN|nr:AAA family ATPase [Actinoplanes capillaceus]GID51405.1 hypothetical protein Aca07nite_86800 [Actinoplanes capillaceus]
MTELEPAGEPAAERARAGVRAWVRDAGRRTRARLRAASPYAILAFLTASTVAPVAGAHLGATGAYAAALDQIGGLGSNFLAEAMAGAAKRLRDTDPEAGGWSQEQWRDAIAADLLPLLAAADERGTALHEEVSRVLRAVDAVGAAIAEAAVTDDELRHLLEAAFSELGLGVGELGWMIAEVRQGVDGLRQEFANQTVVLTRQLDEVRRRLIAVTREQLPDGDEVPADVPGGAVPPYPGLVSFQPEDAPRFRGRETTVAQLLSRLAEQAVGGPPLVVTGVSGVGKSSLLRAGLLPALGVGALGAEAAAWRWVLTNPGVRPLDDLVARLHRLTVPDDGPEPETTSDVAGELLRQVRAEPARLGELAAKAAAAGHRPVIVVDQFEELFTQCPDPAARLAYVTALTSAAPALVVIAVRSDFYPACVALPPLAKVLAAGHLVLGPLDSAAVRRAVVEPAEHAGLTVEPGLPDLLLHDLGADGRDGYDPGALPLLAHALRATWDRREGIRLTVAAYRATGGIRHAIAETAERIYLDLPPDDRDRLRDALLALVTVTGDGAAVRRRGERAASDSRVLRRLVKARLVTVGADTVEISHEALLTSWPRLAGWVDEAREDLLLRRSVTEAARDWDRSGRDPDLLPRGSRLLAARERVPAGDGVPPVVGEFLAAGGAAADREQAEQRKVTRRLRRLAAGLAAALLLAVGGGLVVLDQARDAEDRARESRSRQYALEALRALGQDESQAVGRALDAWREAPTTEARSALLSTQMVRFRGRLGSEPGGSAVAVSPDGSRIAVGDTTGAVRLWDTATLSPVGEPLGFPKPVAVAGLAFSPDGRFLAGGSFQWDGLRIWEAATGRLAHALDGWGPVAWLPGTGTVLASRREIVDGRFSLGRWDAESGTATGTLPAGDVTGSDLSVSPDGRYLAESDVDRKAEIRRLSDGKVMATLTGGIAYVAFAPDGTLVTTGEQGDVIQWAVPSGKRLRDLTAEAGTIPGPGRVTVAPDGTVISTGVRRTASLYSLTGDGTGELDTGIGSFGGAATSANGQIAVVTGRDAPTVVFRRQSSWLNTDGSVLDLAFSPDGARLAAGSDTGEVRVWDTATRELITEFRTAGEPRGVVYGAGGVLAVATTTGTSWGLELWDGTGKRERTVPLSREPKDMAVTADGNLLAVAVGAALADPVDSQYGAVHLYDLGQRRDRGVVDLSKQKQTAYAVAFSADGTVLHTAGVAYDVGVATGQRLWSVLRSWRVDGPREIGGQLLGDYQPLDLAVAPDGSSMVVTGTNRVLDVRSGDGSRSLWTSKPQLDQIDRIVFAPDGRTLAVNGANGDVQLWDTRDWSVLRLQGHGAGVVGLAYTPDGRVLASGGADSLVGVWPLEPAVAVRNLCTIDGPLRRAEGAEVSPLCA